MDAPIRAHWGSPTPAALTSPPTVATRASSAPAHPCPWCPHTAIWPWYAPLVALSSVRTTCAHPLGPIGSPQHPLLGANHPWWPQEPIVQACLQPPSGPHIAIWPWCAPLVGPSRGITMWPHQLGPNGTPQHLLHGASHTWWPQEVAVLLCPPCPLGGGHTHCCHLALVRPTGGT